MSDDENIPDRDTCQIITELFAEITRTNEACAQFYLQYRNWDLERSVHAYYEATQRSGVRIIQGGDESQLVVPRVAADGITFRTFKVELPLNVPSPELSVISWNVNGLDGRFLKRRTKAVCKLIYQENADIVFLQELIPRTFQYYSEKLPDYVCIAGNNEEHFNAVLLRRLTIDYDSHVIIPFIETQMERNLIHVQAHMDAIKFHLFNIHLENGVEYDAHRKSQLKQIFDEIDNVPENHTVIFGGDFNICDKELDTIGSSLGVEDSWKLCGAPQGKKYTWDYLHNTNKSYLGKFKPQMRCDRIYIRPSYPRTLNAKKYTLLGMQKIASTQSYPSNHWGILALFDVEQVKED